jgi:NADH-quinone oxidoreductase subunit L
VASVVAIAGMPFTSGFFSKDEILYRAYVNHMVNPFTERLMARHVDVYEPPQMLGKVLFILGLLAAVMTAFYMFRLLFVTFWGEFRGWTVGRPSILARSEMEHDEHDEHDEHHHEDLSQPGYPPHESPWQMTVPLIILGTFAAFAGFLNAGPLHFTPMEHWLEPVFKAAAPAVHHAAGLDEHHVHALETSLLPFGIAAFFIGGGLAWYFYVSKAGAPAKSLALQWPGVHRFLINKWYVDEFYDKTVLSAVDALGDTAASVDSTLIDGLIARTPAAVVAALGTVLRTAQNGVVHMYAAMMVVGLTAMGWFFVAPHADASVAETLTGDYTIAASQGLGYGFRWDADGNGQPDNPVFTGTDQVKVHLEPGDSKTVRLEVTNAFGFVAVRNVKVARSLAPKLELGRN